MMGTSACRYGSLAPRGRFIFSGSSADNARAGMVVPGRAGGKCLTHVTRGGTWREGLRGDVQRGDGVCVWRDSLFGTSTRGSREAVKRPSSSFSSSSSSTATSRGPQANPTLNFDALTVDIGGTMLRTAQPVEQTYAEFAAKHGVSVPAGQIKRGFREAFSRPWPGKLRYEGDGREFWRFAVQLATGSSDEQLFEDLYEHYSLGAAWEVEEGAVATLLRLKARGVRLAVISNFDSRLRPLLHELHVSSLFDAIVVSAEVGAEKPSPAIFQHALDELGGLDPSRAIHLGDDFLNDVEGARGVGMRSLHWKKEISSFHDLEEVILC